MLSTMDSSSESSKVGLTHQQHTSSSTSAATVLRSPAGPNNNQQQHNNSGHGLRKPLQLLTGIFGGGGGGGGSKLTRSPRGGGIDENESSQAQGESGGDSSSIADHRSLCFSDVTMDEHLWGSIDPSYEDEVIGDEDDDRIPEPREALHSPYHARTIDQDMEHLRLSRQDNPYLQILASREYLNDCDDLVGDDEEEKHLMSKENVSRHGGGGSGSGHHDPLSISEVHARLVRSPPPVMWTRGQHSDPSFSRLTSHLSVDAGRDSTIFQFPSSVGSGGGGGLGLSLRIPDPSPCHSFRSQHSATSKFLGTHGSSSFDYNPRGGKDSVHLGRLSGKLNLSPQSRRRPGGGGPENTNPRFGPDLTA